MFSAIGMPVNTVSLIACVIDVDVDGTPEDRTVALFVVFV